MVSETSFVTQVREKREMLYRLSVSMVRSDADAQDAVQQALEKAWQHRDRVEEGAFVPYLTRIVINECKTQLRRKRRTIPSENLEALGGTAEQPDLALRDALDRLPEKLRTPLVLHYLEGMPLADVSRALRLPESTVRSRVHRARQALRKALQEGGENG